MAPQSIGKSSKTVIRVDRPGIDEISLEGSESSRILSVVREAAMSAPIAELKKAAHSALLIFKATQVVKGKEEAYERLGYDSSGVIVVIWRSFKKVEDPEDWLSAEMRDILVDLSHTLENICLFIDEQLSKSKMIRVILRRADTVKINKFLEHLKYVKQKFEFQSHMSIIKDVLARVPGKNDQTSEKPQEERELEQPEKVETNRQTEDSDDLWLSDDLKKIQQEAKDRKSELERLRVAVRELEEANRLMEEEEIAQLKRVLSAAKEDNRQSNKIRARSSEETSVKQEDKVVEEWEGYTMIDLEDAPLHEEERSSNASGPGLSKRRPVAMEDLQSLHSMFTRSAKARIARRKVSRASLRVQETEDDYADKDEEDDHPPSLPRMSPKGKRNRQTSSTNHPRSVDDFMAQFTPMGLGFAARSSSPMYMPGVHSTYGAPFSPPLGPYGYGVGMPGLVAGTGNINNLTISNVGNDNSVKKVYRPRSQRRGAGNQRY